MAVNELFDTSIKVTGSFGAAGAFPVDAKYVVETVDERNDHVTQNRAYAGMLVYVKADGVTYQYTGTEWKEFGFNMSDFETNVYDGLDSSSTSMALAAKQGYVLDTKIKEHAEDAVAHVTAEERAAWNAKPETAEQIGLGNVTNDAQVKRSEMGVAFGVATLDADGLVPSSQLPSYVDDILEFDTFDAFDEAGESGKIYVALDTNLTYRWSGTQYVEISSSLALGETAATAYAGDKGKANADAIAAIIDGTTTVAKATDAATVGGFTVGVNVPADAKFTDTIYEHPETHEATMITTDAEHRFITDEQLNKLAGIEAGANAYVHPTSHPATMIEEDDTHKFISAEQLAKLDTIEEGANAYSHPGTHEATMIVQDETHRFVTDAEKSAWSAKADTTLVSTTLNGLMAYTDKIKLDGIEEGANNYVHPNEHAATMITTDASHRFATDEQLAKVDAIPANPKYTDTTYAVADSSNDGLMSAADKAKLNGIEEGANNYVHPEAHEAGIITQDETHRFVTDVQIAAWDAKAPADLATESNNGLMTSEMVVKLAGIADGANNYVHPETHAAEMIVEDATRRFVSDEQIANWNAKADTKEDIGLGNVTNDAQVKRTEMGVAGGVATLDENGLVPASQLPSYVDDVVEAANFDAMPEAGEAGKIYVTLDDSKTYRWSGTQYVEISASLALGETSSTAYAGDKGKANAEAIAAIVDGTTTVAKAQDAATVGGLTVLTAVPENAVFTDTTYGKVSVEADGLMSKEDKAKLDGVAEGANNYVHPESHPAAMIVEDDEHRFLTATQVVDLNELIAGTNPSTGPVEFDEEEGVVEINSISLDKNLALEGVAAEAKAVGDKIAALEARIAQLEARLAAL